MKKRTMAMIAGAALLTGAGTTAYLISPKTHSGTSGEAPELGRTGEFSIGTLSKSYSLPNRTTITAWGAVTGRLSENTRNVNVRFWYPAQVPTSGETARYNHTIQLRGKDAVPVTSLGIAYDNAPPFSDQRFPLIIISHGYGGWDAHLSNLGEHLATHGYVVASIHHDDAHADNLPSFLLSFGNVLVDRSQDQRQVFDALMADARDAKSPIGQVIDRNRIGLIGYSMGGYGALASAGAGYDFAKDPLSNLPTTAQEQLTRANEKPLPLKALVTLAPWGGQPDNRAWTAESLGEITTPTLLIAGNQDDIVNYDEGVRWIFDNLKGAERQLLTYREARHNIAGNDFNVPGDSAFQLREYLTEPVWRQNRINTINQHFITAFLDLHVKGDADKSAYLQTPTQDSNAAQWPIKLGEQLNGKLASEEEGEYWRGFQRRWAVGLDFESKSANEQ